MASESWLAFLVSIESLCSEVENRISSSNADTLQDLLLRLQSSRTACKRVIAFAREKEDQEKDASQDVIRKVQNLISAIEILLGQVEKRVLSLDSTYYSTTIFPESLTAHSGVVGRPRRVVNLTQIEYLRSWRFTWTRICHTLCVSRTTLWRRLKEVNYNFSESRFTAISDSELEHEVANIKSASANYGERMVMGMLRSKQIFVARHRVRDIIRKIDPINTSMRWNAMHPRYHYSVPGPNALWHIDGLHKLIKWGFVVHGGIDGYSRLVVFLKCATNNRAETVLASFLESKDKYGVPSRIRTDYGGENAEIGKYMESVRGPGRGSHIAGSSVYNQRIERLHRDTTRCCLSTFYSIFSDMEEEGILDRDNDTDRFCLHFVYLPRINRALEEFRLGWNHHALSTEKNQTPYQRWISGVVSGGFSGYTAVQDILNPDLSNYGVYFEDELIDVDVNNETVIVEEPLNPLNEEQMSSLFQAVDPLSNSMDFGVDIYRKTVELVADFLIRS